MNNIEVRTVDVLQYMTPLREGGSLPALVQASDDFIYVLKFRGAGQGKKALVAARSTIIQSSKTHPGLCAEPEKVLDELFARYVL